MKLAIIYASKHGTTQKVAIYLSQKIKSYDVVLFNLADHYRIDLSGFDAVMVGGSIHAGSINGLVWKFIKNQTVTLLQMPLALFMCGMNEPELEVEFNKAFPEVLRNHAFSKQYVGGEFIFEKMNFFERLITRKITGIRLTTSKINYEAVHQLIADLNALPLKQNQ